MKGAERIVAEVYCPPSVLVRALLRLLSHCPPAYAVVERWSGDRCLARYRRMRH